MSTPHERDDAARRQAIRQFVREHHPDRGGDPETFIAGLRELRSGRGPQAPEMVVQVHRRRRGVVGLLDDWTRRRRTRRRGRRVL
jgi:hypothetical protein